MWLTIILGLAGSVLSGLLGWVGKAIGSAQDKLTGMKQQKAADDAATVADAVRAARAGSEVASETDEQVRADLSKDYRP